MNHGKAVHIANHTTLDLGHRKFAVRYTPRLRLGVYLLQTSSDLGHLLTMVYILHKSLLIMWGGGGGGGGLALESHCRHT